jgi:hypothetical protein
MKRWLSVAVMVGLMVGTVGAASPPGQDLTTMLSKFLQDLCFCIEGAEKFAIVVGVCK